MKVLVELRPEDTVDKEFTDCRNCAMTEAVSRLIKSEFGITEGVYSTTIYKNKYLNEIMCRVSHERFTGEEFEKLKALPKGSFMVYEMDIPKQYLKQTEVTRCHTQKKKEEKKPGEMV